MSYDVFVSYSMGYSSRAYELSAQLSRENVQCYLDCAESGFALGDYTRNLIEESRVYVMLIGANFMSSNYAMASVQCAAGMVKPMLVCVADGVQLPEEMRRRCTLTTEASLLEDLLCLLREEEEDDADLADEPDSIHSAVSSAAPLDGTLTDSKVVGYEPAKSNTVEYGSANEQIEECPSHSEEFASFDWQPLSSSADSAPIFTVHSVCGEDNKGEELEDEYEYEDFGIFDDDEEQTEPLYTEHRGEDPIAELNGMRNEAKQRELERDLLPHNDSGKEEEHEEPSPSNLMQKLSDFFDKNPKLAFGLVAAIILTLLEHCA